MRDDTHRHLPPLERRLLDEFQRDFPLTPHPFAAVAERLGTGEQEVLRTLRRLSRNGLVSRVGPVFRPHRLGTSTLAALAVPEGRLEAVAGLVSGYPEVNHNYQREHRYNLWFVVTAPSREHLERVLDELERRSGLELLRLPMLAAYHLDLGFRLGPEGSTPRPHPHPGHPGHEPRPGHRETRRAGPPRAGDPRLVAAIQEGLPLVAAPYRAVAERAGLCEGGVIERLRQWLDDGTLSRFGVVVHHRELGYRANAMVVWDVPDAEVDGVGRRFGATDFVTLCYRRPRRLPHWRYNLFSMIHGRDRAAVLEQVARLAAEAGLGEGAHEVLFSVRRFKQCGARYHSPFASSTASAAVPGRPAVAELPLLPLLGA